MSKYQRFCSSIFSRFQTKVFTPLVLGLALWGIMALPRLDVWAQSANDAPPELTSLLSSIDSAANHQDIQGIIQFYSPNFTNSDGLNRPNLQQALTQLWQGYPQLKYTTAITSWQTDGQGITAETVTNINGNKTVDSKNFRLESTIRSRQRIENQQIVHQDILAERTQLTAGEKPPTVDFRLPDQVKPGQTYEFDAIVQEPLGNDLLIGTTLEEPINLSTYLKPTSFDLQTLPAGGIFKVGHAPNQANNQWLSAIIVRNGGMIAVTQRLRVVSGTN